MTNFFTPASVRAVLGPTNTGKTHYAVERMLARTSGVIGLPLRLLAREVYDKVCAIKGPGQCALITGEEKIVPQHARYFVCTVEAMPMDREFACVAIDEVQLMAHPERGHIFTDRVLHARGTEETLLLGAETAGPLIRHLLPEAVHESRERFSTLSYSGPTKITRLPKRTAIVAFSASEVYAIAELIRRYRGGAAIVMGALSPRTRNAQAAMFQSGEVDFLVATDAIGMGLNLDVEHVAFASIRKYDGARRRLLTPMEAGQIAGRAGRFRKDGTFGPTGDCRPFELEMVSRIENHDFEPINFALWRNSVLNFDSLDSLEYTLNCPPSDTRLKRVVGTEDELSLERLIHQEDIRESIKNPFDVKQLWEVCQIPDFRNMTIDSHVRLLSDIHQTLKSHNGKLPSEFMEKRVSRLDHTDGGVDILSARLAQIRTWTYCANKLIWMEDANHWVEHTRAVEDRLSDALHDRLTARFVDRRTSALLRGIGLGTVMEISIKDNGDVWTEDHKIGTLTGLSFTLDASQSDLEAKTLAAAAEKVVAPEINRRMTSLCSGTHAIFTLSPDGKIMWGEHAVGKIARGGTVFNPDAELIGGELGQETLRNLAEDRMREFLRSEVSTKLAPLLAIKSLSEKEDVSADARGFAYTLVENLGHIDRQKQRNLTRNLDQSSRGELREVGVFFGQYDVFMPELIRPKPGTLLGLLSAYGAGGDNMAFIPFAGVTSIPNTGHLSSDNFTPESMARSGYKALGPRIIRFDILDRLAGLIRQAQREAGTRRFQIMQEMLALLGCTYEDVQGVLRALGYKSQFMKDGQPKDNAPAELTATVPQRFIDPAPAVGDTDTDAENKEAAPPENAKPETAEAAPEQDDGKPAEEKPSAKPKRQRPALNVFHHRDTAEDGTVTERINNEFWYMPFKGKPGGQNKGRRDRNTKPFNRKGAKPNRKDANRQHSKKKDFSDSPFAALAALKDQDKDKS